MKKINSKKKILCAVCCFALSAFAPSFASVYDSYPNAVDNSMMQDASRAVQRFNSEAGMNQIHDSNTMRDRYQQKEHSADYNYYEQRRNPEASGSNQVIRNNDFNNAFQRATVEELDTKGVYVNSIEVAPSEILTKEEINNLVKPLVGKNVFIEDIQKVIDSINNLYAEKGFVTARAFLPEQTVQNGNI